MSTKRQEIFENIKSVIAETLRVDEVNLELYHRYREDLGADSIDLATLITELEDLYKEDISEVDAQNLFTIDDTVVYIEQNLQNV